MPTSTSPATERTLRTALLVLGAGYVAIALFQAVAPATFVHDVGPFGDPASHYVRDLATWGFALGGGLILAAGHPAWRVPVLVVTVLQGILHLVNHLVDVDNADTLAAGIANAVALAVLVAVEGWLLTVARRAETAR